jgi:hypothetical protein
MEGAALLARAVRGAVRGEDRFIDGFFSERLCRWKERFGGICVSVT